VCAAAIAVLLAAAPGCGGRPPPPSIRIVGTDVVGPAVVVYVRIRGWRMAAPDRGPSPRPRTGQWQIFADDRYAGFSWDRSIGTINGLAEGTYHIWVALARTDYSLVWPLIRSQTVTVHVGPSSY
jgi:hypothetical protein